MQGIKEYIKKDLETRLESLLSNMRSRFVESRVPEDSSYPSILTALYFHEMRHEPQDPLWFGRDHLIASDLKCLPFLFGALAEAGYLQWKSCESALLWANKNLRSHSLMLTLAGISGISSQPLTSALFANGLAMTAKSSHQEYKVFHIISPESHLKVLDPAYAASRQCLSNLTYIACNPTREERILLIHRFFALGWHIEECDPEDLQSLLTALSNFSRRRDLPGLLLTGPDMS
ncbi:MAG: hypothetical protein M1269_02850 [Chloroflexi bacterium]|nr:hypothetical protein [Chloroflexota bacterium]